jgi:hypothetical protein
MLDYTEYNPLDYNNLAKSCIRELEEQPIISLNNLKSFPGAGIYAIYYKGKFDIYKNITQPLYVGKASWEGSRKGVKIQRVAGRLSNKNDSGPLHRRLIEHRNSIIAAENLDVKDFVCHYLVVNHMWINQLETLLINRYHPIWNVAIEGFGLHDPGKPRYNSMQSYWDSLHPGRSWTHKMSNKRNEKEIQLKIQEFYKLQKQMIKTKEEIVEI